MSEFLKKSESVNKIMTQLSMTQTQEPGCNANSYDYRKPITNISIIDEIKSKILSSKVTRTFYSHYILQFQLISVYVLYDEVSFQLNASTYPNIEEVLLVLLVKGTGLDRNHLLGDIRIPLHLKEPMNYLTLLERLNQNDFSSFEYTLLDPYLVFSDETSNERFLNTDQFTWFFSKDNQGFEDGDIVYYINPDIEHGSPYVHVHRKSEDINIPVTYAFTGYCFERVIFDQSYTVRFPMKVVYDQFLQEYLFMKLYHQIFPKIKFLRPPFNRTFSYLELDPEYRLSRRLQKYHKEYVPPPTYNQKYHIEYVPRPTYNQKDHPKPEPKQQEQEQLQHVPISELSDKDTITVHYRKLVNEQIS